MDRKDISRLITFVFVLSTILSLFYILPFSHAQDISLSFKLENPADNTFSYTLNVDVSETLSQYFQGLPHRSATDSDFPKFVTPYVVKPISDAMRQIYPNDEDFANGVLTLVHQIPYNETVPEFYPVETLQKNNGDCDMFSLLAASILKAGGLEVVLLHYTSEAHMNIGVHLNDSPRNTRSSTYSIESNNVTYYVAECTSSSWQDGWRVGESPDDLKNAPATIIALEQNDQVSPGQVSASFTKLGSSSLQVTLSTIFGIQGNKIDVNGQISPAVSNQNVTLYASANGASWVVLTNLTTTFNGQFSYGWSTKIMGDLKLRASWAGNNDLAGATSNNASIFILPLYIIELSVATIIAVVVCIAIYKATGGIRREQKSLENPEMNEFSPETDNC